MQIILSRCNILVRRIVFIVKGDDEVPQKNITQDHISQIYSRNVDTVYRVCYSFMKNKADTEDMVQETFLKLLALNKAFTDRRHEKAWLIVTASNLCKDSIKKWWRRNENIDDLGDLSQPENENREVLDAILALEDTYKTAVYMYYYEGYTTAEIALHMNSRETTVRSRLSRARKQLQLMLGGDEK